MIIKNSKHEITAVKPDQYPVTNLPEITFVGRSNVGKSSFINTLLNRKNLARVGATPGKTKQINFFNVNNELYLVDLPGYGYASVSKGTKTAWGGIVDTYLSIRRQLVLIVMLVDIRHSPTADDQLMYEWIAGHDMPHILVANKADKISRAQVKARLEDIRKTLQLKPEIKVIPFSAENRQGKDEVWTEIDTVLGTLGESVPE